jgi:hypothetical protein
MAFAVASISYALARIFGTKGSHQPAWRSNMSHGVVGSDPRPASGHVRIRRNSIRSHTAFGRANGYLKAVIEAIAAAKLRRLQRELALRGVRYAFPEHGRMPPR